MLQVRLNMTKDIAWHMSLRDIVHILDSFFFDTELEI